MINPLKVSTDGYLKKGTKKLLVIAVAGYLSFAPKPVTPSIPSVPSQSPYNFTMGGGGSSIDIKLPSKTNIDIFGKEQKEQLKKLKLKQLQKEDEEILIFIKIFLECQS